MKLDSPWIMKTSCMRTNILIMCKLMFLLLVVNGFYGYLSDPFLAFIPLLEIANDYHGIFGATLKILFVTSGIFLLFNIRVREMSLILGLVILLALLSSKPLFRNHLFICSGAFILAAFTEKHRDPWLLYVQLSLVYFGAFINKVMQTDWWNGQFMDNWLQAHNADLFYAYAKEFMPDMVLAKVLSWGSMLVEATIGMLLLIKKRHSLAVWMILLFHTALFSVTAFRFGHFFEDIIIYLLVFLNWPKDVIIVMRPGHRFKFLQMLSSVLNWNGQIRWRQEILSAGEWLVLRHNGNRVYNINAIRSLFLFSPGFYFVLFLIDLSVRFLFLHPIEHYISLILFWGGLLFFLPVSWDRMSGNRTFRNRTLVKV